MPSFRAKARAVDLLGKGQIADLPTAICELWKNGYDAYADNLDCNLYLPGYRDIGSPVFTLSDDGTGMSKEDIETRWIVLGTDSKVRGIELLTYEERLGKEPRTPMGEKGIGRLSVAYLGSQMLMFTKKKNDVCNALFMDWRILENYNLYLDDINIAIKDISDQKDIQSMFRELLDEYEANLRTGDWSEHEDLASEISLDLKKLQFRDVLVDEIIANLIKKEDHGTSFIIFDPHEQLMELERGLDFIDDSTTDYLRSSLSGINNAFKDERLFETSFWIIGPDGKYDIIDKNNFFEREDIFNADHYISGSFDENGYFKGELQVFDKRIIHEFRPRKESGLSSYGQFSIEFGVLEGEAKSSKLPREKWDEYKKKLGKFGGLYIYRDGFRVLPYGRTESDFLKFEERRSLSATYYQFSHRRIFGYIGINREKNPGLKDKAGREGFIVNKSFREFTNDLIEFFIDLSVRYFRTTAEGDDPTLREEQVSNIKQKNKRILKAEKKRNLRTKKAFVTGLKENFEKLDVLEEELREIFSELKEENEKVEIIYNQVATLTEYLGKKKSEYINLKVEKPLRTEITDNQKNKFAEFRERYGEIKELITNCDFQVSTIHERLSKENMEEEFEKRYQEFSDDIVNVIKEYEKRYNLVTSDLNSQISEDRRLFKDIYAEKTGHLILKGDEDRREIKDRIANLENIRNSILGEVGEKYDSFVKHVEGLSFEINDDLLVGWYKNEYEKISEKIEAMHELAQLGMAIEIIDHQFNVLYAEMSAAIKFFRQFTDEKPEIKYNYDQLLNAFQHLETNHQLLTPLYRTMRRTKKEIKGSEITDYLNEFFKKRFERHRIDLKTNKSFDDYEFFTYESVIKPVFINIINNALYWLIPVSERKIKIIREDDKILIMNSGEKIEDADLDRIFTLFFSKKPGGRGIGLYLAKTNLHTIGYEIYCTNNKNLNQLKGACFVIEKINGEKI